MFALVCLLYHGIVRSLIRDWWNDPNFSHGFFVPLFSGFLLWEDRRRLAAIPAKPSWWGIGIMAAALAAMVVGVFGSELFLSRTSLILLLAGMAVYFRGWRFFRAVLFPWAILFLMVPLPAIVFNQVALPLQMMASKLASAALSLMGVPVLREGNVLTLPAMPLEVAEACSGIRSLISLVTLAVIYSNFVEPKALGRCLLVVLAAPIAVIANALRIVGTGLLVQYWDPNKALGFFHEFSGWVIFIASLALLISAHGIIRLFVHRPART
jgi:exosortase